MPAKHAYATFVQDPETELSAAVATIGLDALADGELARLIRDGHISDLTSALSELDGDPGADPLEVRRLDVSIESLAPDRLAGHLAAVLNARNLTEAEIAWTSPLPSWVPAYRLADELLSATVLAEYSDATAMSAAGVVGAAAASAEGAVMVALVTAAHVGGVVVMIASPVGIVAVGVGAAYLTYRLLKYRRRR